jgi:hypothetical protein
MKSIEITAALVVVAVASILVSTSTVAAEDREQGEHGSAASDFKGAPDDPSHWGDETSDFGQTGTLGQHSREGAAPGDAPFDENDDTEGRIGVGNNNGDGPSGHGTCVDSDPDNDDALC